MGDEFVCEGNLRNAARSEYIRRFDMKKVWLWTYLCIAIGLIVPGSKAHAQEPPDWAKDLPNLPSLPDYYQGLGVVRSSGDINADWEMAAGQARSEIAKQINVRIVNAVTTTVEEVAFGDSKILVEVFQSTTAQIADATLQGVVVEYWYNEDDSVYYAYAAFSRKELEQKWAEAMQNAANAAAIHVISAQRAVEDGEIYFALTQYLEAIKVVCLAEMWLHKAVLGDLDGTGSSGPILATLQTRFCGLLNKIRFEVVSGDNQAGQRTKPLPKPIVGRILFESAAGRMPIKDAILAASFLSPAEGVTTEEIRTDDKGIFRSDVVDVRAGESINKVRVMLALKATEALVEKVSNVVECWKNRFLDFSFTLRSRADVKIAMHILENNLDRLSAKSSIQGEIQKRLLGGRYEVVEESRVYGFISPSKFNNAIQSGDYDAVVSALSKLADLVVVGAVKTEPRSNPYEGIFFCSGTADIRVIDTASGQIITSVAIDDEKEGGETFELAGRKLLQRLGQRIGDEIKGNIDAMLR